MPSTLGSNEELANLINSTPNLAITVSADAVGFDAVVTANDTEIIARFGAHPAQDTNEGLLRRTVLARLCAIDLNGGDLSERNRALSRIGPLYR